jgi:OOP family OmpA-OmpF porin
MKVTNKHILAAMICAGLPALASATTYANEGYLVDSAGKIVRSGAGLCWHTNYWTSAMAVEGCDPVAVAVAVVAKEEIKNEVKPVPTPAPKPSVIQPPPPTPQPAPVPVIVLPMKVTYSEQDFFDFNESELRPKGKAKLDNLVNDLNGTKYEVIYVTGFTDHIGNSKYNQKLSTRRAEEVKGYLINKGIPADRIKAEGKGEVQPVTHSTDCKGMKSAEEIACLQPDRRVEVTVDGTK